jgi:hypothetical protein
VFKQDILVVDNFFDNFRDIEKAFYQHEFFSKENYPADKNEFQGNWPGFRTQLLNKCNPFLDQLFIQTFLKKIDYNNTRFWVSSYLHSRWKDMKDWIHKDDVKSQFSGLVYLSPTNLESGTRFYDDKENEIADIKFVQNRFVFFNGNYNHMSIGNHGTNIENSRLTLNAFFTIDRS